LYNHFTLATKFIKYWLTAANGKGHGTHSPFIYNFIEKVLNGKLALKNTANIENCRKQLLQNKAVIEVTDFGAGSSIIKTNKRVVANMAKSSLKPKKYAQALAKIVHYYQPQTILELGTSFGITTSYLASANPNATITSFEGDNTIASIAQQQLNTLALKNVEIKVGNFDNTLPVFLQTQKKLDFVFIDGNHAEEPTLSYFEKIKPLLHNDSIVVFDDIHWSKGMENAWQKIQNDFNVSETVDLFFIGIAFFRKEQLAKQQFIIRY
jgi:predicted O-methyltransferase YrrM